MDPTETAATEQANAPAAEALVAGTDAAADGEEKVPSAAPPLLLPPPVSNTTAVTSIDDDDDDDDDEEGQEPSAVFQFTMSSSTPIDDDKIHSGWTPFGGYQWRFLIFPHGNQTNEDLSVYLDCGGPYPAPAARDAWWSRVATFKLLLLTEGAKDGSTAASDVIKEATHNFSPREADWGFREFIKLSAIHGRKQMRFEARVKLTDASSYTAAHSSWAPAWDSRKETGYVGFKNQGATCYLNSLLQTLYCLSAFRRAVYAMPLPPVSGEEAEGKESTSTVAERQSYELQKVFYELQSSPSTVKTKRLTESFGWDNAELFQQHDAQELNRVLCDRLAETLKRVKAKDTVAELFEGKTTSFVECIDVDYTSSRDEVFYDLSLNVLGLSGVDEALRAYTAVEMMDGDNRVRADGYEELQRAKKGVRFAHLPPVLQLHLKRFDFDFARDPPVQVKINDYFHFGAELDLRSFVTISDKTGGTDDADRSPAAAAKDGDAPSSGDAAGNGAVEPAEEEDDITAQMSEEDAVYILHAVLVHIGDVDAGHYCAFIRPDPEQGQWYKFDDETVTKVSSRAAIDDNYGVGGLHQPPAEEHALNKATRGAKTKKKGVTSPQALSVDNTSPTRNSGDVLSADVENSPALPPPTRKARFRTTFGPTRRFGSAYMLQYVRKSQAKDLLASTNEADVPKGLAERIDAERQAETLARRERAEQHLYISASILTAASMGTYGGSDLSAWVNLPRVKAKRSLRLREFKELLVSQGHGRSADALRVWQCTRRQNDTVRPGTLLAGGMDNQAIVLSDDPEGGLTGDGNTPGLGLGRHHPRSQLLDEGNLRLFVEELTDEEIAMAFAKQGELDVKLARTVPSPTGVEPSSLATAVMDTDGDRPAAVVPPLPQDEILLFVKQYLPLARERQLRIIGRVMAKRNGILQDVLPDVVELAGLAADTPVHLFEEVSATLIEPVKLSVTCTDAELVCGDILVVESAADTEAYKAPDAFANLSPEERAQLPLGGERLAEAPMYFRYLSSGVRVEFRDKWASPDSPAASPTAAATTSPVASSPTAAAMPGKVTLELLRSDHLHLVKSYLARALGDGANPDYLRLFVHDLYHDCPRPKAVMPNEARELSAMLPGGNWAFQTTTSDEDDARVLWYERTDYPAAEYAHKLEVRVTWRPDGGAGGTTAAQAALKVQSSTEDQVSVGDAPNQLAGALADASLSDEATMSDVSNGVHPSASLTELASDAVPPAVVNPDLPVVSGVGPGAVGGGGNVTSLPPTVPLEGPVPELVDSGVKVAASRQLSVLVDEDATLEAVAREVHRRLALPAGVSVRLLDAKGSVIPRRLSLRVPVRGASEATLSGVAEMRAEPVRPDDFVGDARWNLVPLVHISPNAASAAAVRGRANGGQLGANGNTKTPALNVASKPRRAPSLFGSPLLFPVLVGGETVGALRERIRERLAVPASEFASWRLTQMINWRLLPLEDEAEMWTPAHLLEGDEWSCLAIEHKSTSVHKRPVANNNRMADKPLTIRS